MLKIMKFFVFKDFIHYFRKMFNNLVLLKTRDFAKYINIANVILEWFDTGVKDYQLRCWNPERNSYNCAVIQFNMYEIIFSNFFIWVAKFV